METMSISEVISSLKTAFRTSQYDAVAKILVARDEQQKQIIEALKQDMETAANKKPIAASQVLEREMNAEEIYENMLQNDTLKDSMEEVEQLRKENQRLKQLNEALGAFMEEMGHRYPELQKGIESLWKDMSRSQEKDGDRQNSTIKLRRTLDFHDIVHSSADNKTSTIEEHEAILGEVVPIIDVDDECVSNESNHSAKTTKEKGVKRKRDKLIAHDHDTNKDNELAGRQKMRPEISSALSDLHSSSRECLNDSVVLENCGMLNVDADDFVSPLIKSEPDVLSQSTCWVNSSYSVPQKVKMKPRDASSVSKGKIWNFDVEMAADLIRNDLLCMEAVCALHKHRNLVAESLRKTSQDNSGPKLNLLRKATHLAEFLTNEDPHHRLKRSVTELTKWGHHSISECRKIAVEFLKEWFELYRKDEDLFASKS